MITIKDKLFTLWIFVTVNYIFCDIFTLFYSENLKQLITGTMGGMEITEIFLFGFSIIMELPMLMIVTTIIIVWIAINWKNEE